MGKLWRMTGRPVFRPKVFETWREWKNPGLVLRECVAGLVVGLMALPLAIGFGIASVPGGVPQGMPGPAAMGLWTAVVAGFLISLLGGSRVQIGGPTGAFIPIVAQIVLRDGLPVLWTAIFLAGVMLVVMGWMRAGVFSRFIPLPVVTGFTAGIAAVIVVTAIPDLAGFQVEVKGEMVHKLEAIWGALAQTDPRAAGFSAVCLVLVFALPSSWRPRVAVLLLGSVAANALGWTALPGREGLATIESVFGRVEAGAFVDALPRGLPAMRVPDFSWGVLQRAIPAALVIGFLAAVESILSAMATDKKIGDRHDPDQELLGQGIANVVVSFLGGLPVTGAIARSAANVQMGGRTPLAGMVHACCLAAMVLLLPGLLGKIPMAVLAVILVHVAWKMVEFHHLAMLRRVTGGELAVALVTFALTFWVDLTVGVAFGLGVSAVMLILRLRVISHCRGMEVEGAPPWVRVLEVSGIFFYAVAEDLAMRVQKMVMREPGVRVVVLEVSHMLSVDYDGLLALQDLMEDMERRGWHLILCRLQPQPARVMLRHGLLERIGIENLCGSVDQALGRARVLADGGQPMSRRAD